MNASTNELCSIKKEAVGRLCKENSQHIQVFYQTFSWGANKPGDCGDFQPCGQLKSYTEERWECRNVCGLHSGFWGVWFAHWEHPAEWAVLATKLETHGYSGKTVWVPGGWLLHLTFCKPLKVLQLCKEKGGSKWLINHSFTSHRKSCVLESKHGIFPSVWKIALVICN